MCSFTQPYDETKSQVIVNIRRFKFVLSIAIFDKYRYFFWPINANRHRLFTKRENSQIDGSNLIYVQIRVRVGSKMRSQRNEVTLVSLSDLRINLPSDSLEMRNSVQTALVVASKTRCFSLFFCLFFK